MGPRFLERWAFFFWGWALGAKAQGRGLWAEGQLVGEMGIEPTPEPPKDSALPLQLLPDLVDCADGITSICTSIMAP